MAHDPTDENGKILRARLLTLMQEELEAEADDALALRKALLAAIFVSPAKEPAVARQNAYLLTEFGPLSDHFVDDLHPFIQHHDVRRSDDREPVEMLVHQSLHEAIMGKPVTAHDIISAGLRLPWEPIAERFVGCFEIVNYESLLVGKLDDLQDVLDGLRSAIETVEDVGPWKDEAEGPLHYPGCWIRYLHLGERIFLFTRDSSSKSHIIALLAAQRLFMEATGVGIGLRGGIVAGESHIDPEQAVYVGQSLLDAQQLAQRQLWFGVALHPSMDGAGKDNPEAPAPENVEGWILMTDLYDIPFEDGTVPDQLAALNWAMLFHQNPVGLDQFLEPLTLPHDPALLSYYLETKQFGHEMLDRMKAVAKPKTRLH